MQCKPDFLLLDHTDKERQIRKKGKTNKERRKATVNPT